MTQPVDILVDVAEVGEAHLDLPDPRDEVGDALVAALVLLLHGRLLRERGAEEEGRKKKQPREDETKCVGEQPKQMLCQTFATDGESLCRFVLQVPGAGRKS